jgi:hypothetical protein
MYNAVVLPFDEIPIEAILPNPDNVVTKTGAEDIVTAEILYTLIEPA